MAVRPCLRWPHPLLRQPAVGVAAVDDAVRAIWTDMIYTLEAMPGYGLAAPQIGVGLQLVVVDCSSTRGQAVRMANPKLVAVSEALSEWDEGSPNLPGVSARIRRPRQVTGRFLDDDGAGEERVFTDLWATSVQHQIDHLGGRMFFDRLGAVKRRMLVARALKIGRRA
ncbi:MAG TPA: peptide deformylase [Paracoccaceae bacterium]|nr:peptide deformylase [Paracoccaceae bacterium]